MLMDDGRSSGAFVAPVRDCLGRPIPCRFAARLDRCNWPVASASSAIRFYGPTK